MRIWLPLVVVALLVGAGWWLLDSEPSRPGEEDLSVVGTGSEESAAEVSLSVLETERDGAEDHASVAAGPGADASSAREADRSVSRLPKAYREALSGITGRLVDHEDEPVAGLEITLLEANITRFIGGSPSSLFDEPERFPRLDIGRDVTDEDGRFRFAGAHAAASFHAMGIDLGGERGSLRIIDQSLHPGESYDLGDVKLEPFVTFVGQVVDETGQPIAGARVRATNVPAVVFEANVHYLQGNSSLILAEEMLKGVARLPREVMKWESKLPVPTIHTDSEGKFRIAGVPIGLITTVVDKPGYGSAIQGPTPSGRSGERSVGTVTLPSGRIARGRVVDASQQPVEGAHVEVGAVCRLGPVAIGVPAEPTDADGRFEVRGLPDTGSLVVAARAHRSDPWTMVGPTEDEQLLVVLEERVPFVVIVQDPGEVPIEKAEILLSESSPLTDIPIAGLQYFHPPPQEPEVIAPGEYRFDRLVPGRYQIVVRAPGFAPATEEIQVLPDGSGKERVILRGGMQVQLRVIDASTEAPLESAVVQAYVDRRDTLLDRARTDEEGRAMLGPLGFDPKTETRVWVEHPGYAGRDLVLEPTGEEVVVELEPGVELRGAVHVGGAVPDRGYMLVLTDFEGQEGGHPAGEMPRIASTSSADGTFRVTNLPAGPFRWELFERFLQGDPVTLFRGSFEDPPHDPDQITRGRFELTPNVENFLEIDISPGGLTRPGTVHGTIVVNGAPGADWRVEAQIDPREDGVENRQVKAPADAWGHFTINDVPPGSVRLEVKRPAEENGSSDDSSLWSEWHEMMPGEDYQPRIELSLRSVTFQVSDPTGSLVAGAGLQVSSHGRGGGRAQHVETNARGVGTLEVVGDQITVNASHGDMILEREIDLSGYRGETIELALSPAVPCRGRIEIAPGLLGDGPNRDFVYLWVRSTDGSNISQNVSVDKNDLRFGFPGMKPGRYTVRCFAGGGGLSKGIEFTLPPEGDTNLFFRFEEGGGWGD